MPCVEQAKQVEKFSNKLAVESYKFTWGAQPPMVTISHFARVVTVVCQFLARAANQRIIYSQISKGGEKELWLLKRLAVSRGPFSALSFRAWLST